MTYVKKYYDAISQFKINIPTPVGGCFELLSNSINRCVLVDIDDTLPSIFSGDMVIGRYVASQRVNLSTLGRIRGHQCDTGEEVQHTGVITISKKV